MVSFRAYSAVSLILATGCIAHAVSTRQQFYPSVLYLTTNKVNVMILGNLCFFLLTVLYKLCRKVFLNELAREEEEELILHAKWSITETCLALTMFLNEFDVTVIVLFSGLLFSKIFHWLAAMRVEQAGRVQGVPWLVHFRLLALLTLLGVSDCLLAYRFAMHLTTLSEPSVLLLFAFEFMILAVLVVSLYGAYLILVLDTRWEGRWPTKSHWVFYFGFTTDLTRLLLYVIFFIIVCTYFTVPIYLFRELWVHMFKFGDRIEKFIAYKRLTSNMKERFPEATEQECMDADGTHKKCIICRDDLTEAKKLPCGHLFHFNCLRTWLERSQRCPTCRANIPIGFRPAAADANLNIQQANANVNANANNANTGNAAGAAPEAGEVKANAPIVATQAQPEVKVAGVAVPVLDVPQTSVSASMATQPTIPLGAGGPAAPTTPPLPGGLYVGGYPSAYLYPPTFINSNSMLSHGPGPAPPTSSPFFSVPPPLSTIQAQTLLLQQHIELVESQLAHLKTLYEAHLDFQLRLVSEAQEESRSGGTATQSQAPAPATSSSVRVPLSPQERKDNADADMLSFFASPPHRRSNSASPASGGMPSTPGSGSLSGGLPSVSPRLQDAKSIDREAKLDALVRRLSLRREESQSSPRGSAAKDANPSTPASKVDDLSSRTHSSASSSSSRAVSRELSLSSPPQQAPALDAALDSAVAPSSVDATKDCKHELQGRVQDSAALQHYAAKAPSTGTAAAENSSSDEEGEEDDEENDEESDESSDNDSSGITA
eukprot:gb/GEZN01002036.1/.p1 GENE.gb/GEZN01002036.1/~~gb/GEZN01002036.1/.p1  ORF type:complete len:773 (+),score=115.33 gb/GEZN01002036.1/:98-2416(+)